LVVSKVVNGMGVVYIEHVQLECDDTENIVLFGTYFREFAKNPETTKITSRIANGNTEIQVTLPR
jgi:hypothetical protein